MIKKNLGDRKDRTKNLKKNLLLLLAVLFLFFLIFEFFLRVFLPQPVFVYTVLESSGTFYNQSEYLPWQIKPSVDVRYVNEFGEFNVSVKHNSFGYRNEEFNIAKSPDIIRILVLGDSFTYGFGVELSEIYHKVFERRINEKVKKYELINAGYKSGDGPNTEYLYLKREGLSLDPDIVMVGFFMGNDFTDHKNDNYYFDKNGGLYKIVSENYSIDENNRLRTSNKQSKGFIEDNFYKVNVFLSFHMHSYVFFKNRFRRLLSDFYRGRPSPSIYANEYDTETKKDVGEVFDFLLRMRKITEENNSTLVIVLIPSREEVYDYKVKDTQNNLLNWSHPYYTLTKFAEENNITLINLLPKFKEYSVSNGTSLYFLIDPHWNKNGHYVAGQALYEEFQKTMI